MQRRASGVLLHATSLPSRYGIGDFGPGARHFARFLAQAAQSYWQVLPLTPTSTAIGNSPYSSDSAFAMNLLFLSPDKLVEDGWLSETDIGDDWPERADAADYEAAEAGKLRLVRLAFDKARSHLADHADYQRFCRDEASWLDDFALFRVIKNEANGAGWAFWPPELRDRRPEALADVRHRLGEAMELVRFGQFLVCDQWAALRRDMGEYGIQVVGDLPIYVTEDSVDVWAHPELFKLGQDRRPLFVAGVPPDYFSETGQRWGNPVYDWQAHSRTDFAWWIRRLRRNMRLFDTIRLDHFRGFEAYWEIEASEKTAVHGRWVTAPGQALFKELLRHFPVLPLIAEDLGVITAEVRELKAAHAFPGMKILQFAFGEDIADNRDAPHNYERNCVAYTGTHDNNTTLGWARGEAGENGLRTLFAYLGREIPLEEIPWAMLRLCMRSAANTVITPMQDLLCLGEGSRMNTPSVAKGNWRWRVAGEQLDHALAERLRAMTAIFGRNH